MTERRLDPYTGRAILVARGRRGIGATRASGLPEPAGRCPFCPGHEADAEPTVAACAWQVRVVRNKFPLVRPDEGAFGVHEVGVDARAHDVDLADLDAAHLVAMLGLYRARCAALSERPGIETVVLFRNRGRRAGSSQPHPHSQIVALGHVPDDTARRAERAERFFSAHAEALHDAERRRERAEGRVLAEADEALLVVPYAPTRSFEMRVLPAERRSHFHLSSDETLASTATLLADAARRLRALGLIDFNLIVRQPPLAARGAAHAWHLEILPRTGGDAGFELATGEMIVVVSPEDAARALRGDA